MIKKILIANRGEIALRIIRTAKEMGIKTVAVYSTADIDSLHVRFADEAVCIGPAASSESYLNTHNILAAAEITSADAIHPGYGFLAESSAFSKLCEEHGVKFIGASPEMIDRMGDKANAKSTMKAAGVPTVPGSDGIVEDFETCQRLATEMGYPVMLKASAGGGGKGMRAVWKEEGLLKGWDDARQESLAAFGDNRMYMEKLIEDPRHIEIQVVGDQYGKACHLSERDCSIQRRHQKLTEETPSPFMTDELRKKMGDAAVLATAFIKYEGVGTIEFLVDKHRDFYFMEMNTRIQVEQIMNFHAPGGHGIRVDTHVYAGYTIPPYYDSMIAKLITTAQSREEAINKMKRALDEFVIEGVKTTIPFQRALMDDPAYLNGDYTTAFMDSFVLEKEV